MANYRALPSIFAALADPTRLAIVRRLAQGPAPVSLLASQVEMTLPSFLRHLRVLEEAGIIRTHKAGRVRICNLQLEELNDAQAWLASRRRVAESRKNSSDSHQ